MIIRGSFSIVIRRLTVLIALVAQGMALMSPVCLVRCVSPNGHECVELVGQGCRGCEHVAHEAPQGSAESKCGHHPLECDHGHEDDRLESVEWKITFEHCACQHSLVEVAPQVQSRIVTTDTLSNVSEVILAPNMLSTDLVDGRMRVARSLLLRPQESPHLTVLAAVVLRV